MTGRSIELFHVPDFVIFGERFGVHRYNYLSSTCPTLCHALAYRLLLLYMHATRNKAHLFLGIHATIAIYAWHPTTAISAHIMPKIQKKMLMGIRRRGRGRTTDIWLWFGSCDGAYPLPKTGIADTDWNGCHLTNHFCRNSNPIECYSSSCSHPNVYLTITLICGHTKRAVLPWHVQSLTSKLKTHFSMDEKHKWQTWRKNEMKHPLSPNI